MSKSSQTPQEIEDPGGQNQKEQIRQLNNVRENITSVRNTALDKILNSQMSSQKANSAYRQSIVAYIMQLAPYIQGEDYGGESNLWDEEELGKFTVKAPAVETGAFSPYNRIEPKVYTGVVNGVSDLLKMPSPIPVKFTAYKDDEVKGEIDEVVVKKAEIDRATLDSIVIRLDEFRRDVGLGLQLPDEITDESDEAF